MRETSVERVAAVRLEGGVGDHVLGMRVLPFVRDKYPDHRIVVYSDCAGHDSQLSIVSMSPYVDEVRAVYRADPPRTLDTMGRIETLRPHDIRAMLSSDVFIDAWGSDLFTSASAALDVSLFDILARRPELVIPRETIEQAERFLEPYGNATFVGLNVTKYGARALKRLAGHVWRFLDALLDTSTNVVILNMFRSCERFPHWPTDEQVRRQELSTGESEFLREISAQCDRIVPCVDLPIVHAAALLKRCKYFVGLDNGIKHLAWALGVPHTFFHPAKPSMMDVLRWMPDANRMLLFDCSERELSHHVDQALRRLHA